LRGAAPQDFDCSPLPLFGDVKCQSAKGSFFRRTKTMSMLLISGIFAVALLCHLAPANAAVEHDARWKDARWDALLAEEMKHGGVETITGPTGSFVFLHHEPGKDDYYLTFTRSLDNKIRLICIMPINQLVNICSNWNTGTLSYATRAADDDPANVHSWRISRTPHTLSPWNAFLLSAPVAGFLHMLATTEPSDEEYRRRYSHPFSGQTWGRRR
jgi:hypothetical protein